MERPNVVFGAAALLAVFMFSSLLPLSGCVGRKLSDTLPPWRSDLRKRNWSNARGEMIDGFWKHQKTIHLG
jgi:hypothetical protein